MHDLAIPPEERKSKRKSSSWRRRMFSKLAERDGDKCAQCGEPHPLERACARCGAEAGQPCLGKRGHERKSFHRERGSRRKAHAVYSVDDLVTESPIERTLAGAIREWIDYNFASDLVITTQAPIGPYRADILIADGERRLIVECDGAGFHNSREQVERDKRRDRYCAARGIAVMRFTGSEIHRDPRGCAAEVGLWIRGRQ